MRDKTPRFLGKGKPFAKSSPLLHPISSATQSSRLGLFTPLFQFQNFVVDAKCIHSGTVQCDILKLNSTMLLVLLLLLLLLFCRHFKRAI